MEPELLQRSFMSHRALRVIHHHFFSSGTLAVIAKLESKWDQNHLNLLKAPKQKAVNEYILVFSQLNCWAKEDILSLFPLESFFLQITNSYPGLPLLPLVFFSVWNPLLCFTIRLNAAQDSVHSPHPILYLLPGRHFHTYVCNWTFISHLLFAKKCM